MKKNADGVKHESVEDWAKRHSYRSHDKPGPWKCIPTPYLKDIMESLKDEDIENVRIGLRACFEPAERTYRGLELLAHDAEALSDTVIVMKGCTPGPTTLLNSTIVIRDEVGDWLPKLGEEDIPLFGLHRTIRGSFELIPKPWYKRLWRWLWN